MASKQTIFTLEEAVEKVLHNAESKETDIVILLPQQGGTYATDLEEDDEDICYRGDSLSNDVAIAVPAQKNLGGNEFLPKFCDVCSNHDFIVYFGYDKIIF